MRILYYYIGWLVLILNTCACIRSMGRTRLDLVWFPDPSVMRMRGRGKKGLGNNYTLARARGWNLQKVLESISSRCYTNFCPQVVLATCTIRLRNCLFVNIHDRVTLSANHSHLEVRAGQIPGPVRKYSYFPDPSFPSRACA